MSSIPVETTEMIINSFEDNKKAANCRFAAFLFFGGCQNVHVI